MTQIYQNSDWLYNQYIELDKSSIQISREREVNQSTITRWLRKFNLRKNKPELYQNREWLYHQYIGLGKTTYEIANICNCSYTTILNWLKRFKIATRDHGTKGSNHHAWKGGKRRDKDGYWIIYKPNHLRARGNFVLEHFLIMEQKIGRYLKPEEKVHHIDLDKGNNDIDNLYLCKNHREHHKLHRQLQEIAIELYKLKKAGYIKFNKEKGKYYKILKR